MSKRKKDTGPKHNTTPNLPENCCGPIEEHMSRAEWLAEEEVVVRREPPGGRRDETDDVD